MLGTVAISEAHLPNAVPTCSALRVTAESYPAGSRLVVVIDGITADAITFGGDEHRKYVWGQFIDHTWKVTIDSFGDDFPAYKKEGVQKACQTIPTIPPTSDAPSTTTAPASSTSTSAPASTVAPTTTSSTSSPSTGPSTPPTTICEGICVPATIPGPTLPEACIPVNNGDGTVSYRWRYLLTPCDGPDTSTTGTATSTTGSQPAVVVTPSPSPSSTISSGVLPVTGADEGNQAWIAGISTLVGIAAVIIARRRNAKVVDA